MRKKITLFFLLVLSLSKLGATQNNNILIDRWNQYIKTKTVDEAKAFIDPMHFASLYGFVQPGSELINLMKPVSEEIYGNSGRIFVQIYEFKTWIAFKKLNENWVMTMDENEILEHLTKNWIQTKVGSVTYVSSSPLNEETLKEAEVFAKENDRLSKEFGIKLNDFKYYYAKLGEEAENVVGEMDKNTGKARYRAIKAVETVSHVHELVHIYAFEFGSGNPFIDEGVATCFGNKNMSKTAKRAQNVLNLIEDCGYEKYLNPPTFVEANMQRKNVYALAQLTIKYWKEKYGMKKVKDLLAVQKNPEIDILKYIENNFENKDLTNNALREILRNNIKESSSK